MDYGVFLSKLEGMDGVAVTITDGVARAGDLGDVIVTYSQASMSAQICYDSTTESAATQQEMEARVRAALVFLEWRNKILTSWR